ncbi:DUF4232 domain-containing protein [Streptomyces beijiangensis]|uniref:DUF4232 domain-containing protein n=1 Tax=Streptomyces beijiangensis TaxID=163361 RepID=A0A939JIM7_9ACTN|nr:DUF4232 domain-containing protein [Streptomyces beijiangensis]MBO0513350.1 DUF4232 domain-containing protein [Streptomyces beijiangensis]
MTTPVRRSVPASAALAALALLTAVGATGCGSSPKPMSAVATDGARPAPSSSYLVHADKLPTPGGTSATQAPYGSATLPEYRPSEQPKADCSAEPGLVIKTELVNAAMGLRSMTFTLTNCSGRPLALNGYPDLRVLDADRKPVTPRATPSPYGKKPAPVTLLSGETATSSVIWRNTVTDANVTATVGTYLLIAPARGDATQTVKSGEPLDLGNTGKAQVSPWARQQ